MAMTSHDRIATSRMPTFPTLALFVIAVLGLMMSPGPNSASRSDCCSSLARFTHVAPFPKACNEYARTPA